MDFRLVVVSIISPNLVNEPRVVATRDILAHHGYHHIQHVDHSWIGWPSKLLGFIRIVQEIKEDYTHIMFVDARDIVVLAGPEEIMERWHKFNHPWVYNAEPFIWSPNSFQPEDYPTPQCTYRYLNGGASLGELDHISRYFNKWTDDGKNLPLSLPRGDQDWLAAKFIEEYPDAIMLDHNCELFQCMCGSLVEPNPHCTMSPGKVHNSTTGTDPLIIHFNGGDDITAPDRRFLWEHWI